LGHKDPENVNRAITVYRNHIPVLHLFPEVPGLLKTLKSRFLLGIVTDGDWRIQERKITALGLTEFFTAIVLTDQLGPDSSKPSPKPFLAALERLGVTAESTCYIGDNIRKDFLGARKVGLKTIWIRKNDGIYSGIEPPTPDHRPDFIIDSLSKLEKLLATL
jgi:putative hydrolase of the HAD superfamily